MSKFLESLPSGFYEAPKRQVKAMNICKKSRRVTKAKLKSENVLKFQLAPIPTSISEDSNSLIPPKSKSVLKTIKTKVLVWKLKKQNFIVTDGCAILYIFNELTKALLCASCV